MIRSRKLLSVLLSFMIFFSTLLTGCSSNEGKGIGDFISGIFSGGVKHEPTEEALLPQRPYIIKENVETQDLSLLLSETGLKGESLLIESSLEEQLFDAKTLDEVADTRNEVNNLVRIKNELIILSDLLETDPDPDPELQKRTTSLIAKIDDLLTAGIIDPDKIKASTAFIGTWTTPDKVVLRWSPQKEWIPDDGYDLYRTIGGKTEMIAEGLGTEEKVSLSVQNGKEFSEYIKVLYDQSKVSAQALSEAGVSTEEEFNEYVFRKTNPVLSVYRFGGAEDFESSRITAFSVSGTLAERVPETDRNSFKGISHISGIRTLAVSVSLVKSKALFDIKASAVTTDSAFEMSESVALIASSRNDFLTKANTDVEFAEAAGFGYEDELEGKELKKEEIIEYVLVPQKPALKVYNLAKIASGDTTEGIYSVKIPYGIEEVPAVPEALIGYGADNAVFLRWKAPEDQYMKSIISGYHIERKKNKESKFTRINEVPVVIPYMQDENGIFFEMPVFYSDLDIANGENAVYRVQAVDIFGRLSEYSEALPVTVFKVTPPNTPNLDQPALSSQINVRSASYVKEAAELNSGKPGIVVPITKTSEDTTEFVVYRSLARGNGIFEAPIEIARIPVEVQKTDVAAKKTVRFNKVKLLVNPESDTGVHTIYYDADIEQGSYYKYWVAAADSVGNESAWSGARVVGYPTDRPPLKPLGAKAGMEASMLPDKVIDVPGFSPDRILDTGTADENDELKTGFTSMAGKLNVNIGISVSDVIRTDTKLVPGMISQIYSNLPEAEDIHDIVALENKDLLSDGTARVKWYHYAGPGLKGYHVYRAYVDGSSLTALEGMSRVQVTEAFEWKLVAEGTLQNQLTDKVEQDSGRIYLYIIVLVPEETKSGLLAAADKFNLFAPGGWVRVEWDEPDEIQLGYYRIYRAEVPYFTDNQEIADDNWTMVADNVRYRNYSEKVDQTYARYYYYKITSVSIWGEESEEGDTTKIRVPATSPPNTPSMLIPFAQKGKVQIQWVGVPHASKYIIYRHKLPRVSEEDVLGLQKISPEMFEKVFTPKALSDSFLTDRIKSGISLSGELKTTQITQQTIIPSVSKFNTIQLVSKKATIDTIGQIKVSEKVDLYKNIVSKYGVLAVAPYGQLDLDMAKLVLWDKVSEVNIAQGDESTGVFKYTDEDVLFGDTYLYTVQAANDDNLYSGRPDPVTVSPRKASPFPPVTGVKGGINDNVNLPEITWDPAKDPNLGWKESREHIAGYLVYKSNTENGTYYQTSELLIEATFVDRKADVNAANWYKIKVVDTGGFISDFSAPVKIQKAPDFFITGIKKISPLTTFKFNSVGDVALPVILTTITINPIKPIKPIIPITPVLPDTLTINGFTVTGITSATLLNGKGDAVLKIGGKYEVEATVNISRRQSSVITQGSVQLKQPVSFDDVGVYISELSINTSVTEATVSGYVKSTGEGNLFGDLYALKFNKAKMDTSAIIKITQVPVFHYDNLTFKPAELVTVNLGGITQKRQTITETTVSTFVMPTLVYGSSLVTFFNGQAENDLGMETLDNKGLKLSYGMLGFDISGKLEGDFALVESQVVRAVIPAGLGIKVTAAKLSYRSGSVDPAQSSITGKVLLPFDTFEDSLPVEFDSNLFIKTYSTKRIVSTDVKLHETLVTVNTSQISLDDGEKAIVDRGMYYASSRIQANALKVLPMDLTLQEKLSSAPFNVQSWDGRGFVVQDTTMTPALVGNADEEIGVTPGKVAIDLSREASYQGTAPEDTKNNDWMGIVVKNGRVGLPPAFIKTDDDTRVLFKLTPGELLYDRNGIFYQNQAYSEEGIPVNLGDSLGGFRDVIVNLIFLDIYNNKVNLEIQGDVGIPLFGYQRAKIRLYTSKELGKLVCSVAETEKFDPSGSGDVLVKILGGHLRPDGLHMDGTIDLLFEDKLVMEDMRFVELIVPADMEKMKKESNPEELYGRALFDKAYRIKFHDFEMDVRAIEINSFTQNLQISALKKEFSNSYNRDIKLSGKIPIMAAAVSFYRTDITLWGAMQLSDNLSMDMNEDYDRIVIKGAFNSPEISYEESQSKLDIVFEDFVSVKAMAVPVIGESGDGIVEYNTDSLDLAFNTAASMIPGAEVKANVRLGYDKTMGRYFFAIGIYYHDPAGGIQFGIASLNDITGVIGYNLDLPYNEESGYTFPGSKDGFFNSIDSLEVNREPAGNYFFAATAWMYLGYDSSAGNLKLGEIRNIYMVVEKGPNIEMGGDYYGPSTVQSLMTGNDLKLMGKARLGYYHSSRHFKFSLSLYDFGMYGTTVSGDLGFDMSPTLWELRIGYPEMLIANMGGMTGGFGFTIRFSDLPDDSYIKAQMQFGYDTGDVSISLVYFRAYLYVGGGGEYYFDSGNIVLFVYIEGGLEGGIKVSGKKYRIIHMMVGADGKLTRYTGKWNLDANVRISYHLDLFLLEVGGSVKWHMSKDF